MATEEIHYYGGDYRTWKNVPKKPTRSQYAPGAVRANIFPEDNLKYLADPNKPFTFYWHSTHSRFDDEIDDLQDRGYFRVIVEAGPGEQERPDANFTNPTRWRRGPGGTVIWKGHELWAQPGDLADAQEAEQLRRLNPRQKASETEEDLRIAEENIKRQGIDGIEIVAKPRPSKSSK